MRLVGVEALHLQPGERAAPAGVEIAAVERQQIIAERTIFVAERLLLARAPEHPALLAHAVGDAGKPAQKGAPETLVCVEARHADRVEILAARLLEQLIEEKPAGARRGPIGDVERARFRLQQLIGALGELQARESLLALVDERLIGMDEQFAIVELEHGVEMLLQRLGVVGERTAEEIVAPIAPLEGENHLAIDGRARMAEHQIDLQRLIDEARIVAMLLEQFLEAEQKPRPQQTLQRETIGGDDASTRRGRWPKPKPSKKDSGSPRCA